MLHLHDQQKVLGALCTSCVELWTVFLPPAAWVPARERKSLNFSEDTYRPLGSKDCPTCNMFWFIFPTDELFRWNTGIKPHEPCPFTHLWKYCKNCAKNQQQTPKTTIAYTPEVLPESNCDVGHPKAEAHQAHNSGDAPTVCWVIQFHYFRSTSCTSFDAPLPTPETALAKTSPNSL